ncbi:alanine racemase [Alteromonas confluentis]|uniref:D-serine dehydratase-like domain-containing protein n=1 Tax=Alteromonas confluentis TaxID=1656094 RepID=A0A1E7ZC60_9ALTE|nr:alanine racemase [Alteromonas confluentis]OFC71105.1 hypothetical protein BFC18_09940 [Alteromonas confluentis]
MTLLSALITPACVIDINRLERNSERMLTKCRTVGLPLRPHVKTLKSTQAAAIYAPLPSAITVSTLAEARYFAGAGYQDILYAVGLTPNKYEAVNKLLADGVAITVAVDNPSAVDALTRASSLFCKPLSVVIELDVDDHRAGIAPESETLLSMAKQINDAEQLAFSGVMAHAGASYGCNTQAAQTAMAKQECERTAIAAERLADAGLPCRVVSVGSTPTALSDYKQTGITEIRAGVYATFDLVMADLNVCAVEDIALSVLTTVIGHQPKKNWVLVDAGWMGLSRDKGSNNHGYGLVTDASGKVLDGWYVSMTNQEHGIIEHKDKLPIPDGLFEFGSQLRILPNHACATAGQYRKYFVTRDNQTVSEVWDSADGW